MEGGLFLGPNPTTYPPRHDKHFFLSKTHSGMTPQGFDPPGQNHDHFLGFGIEVPGPIARELLAMYPVPLPGWLGTCLGVPAPAGTPRTKTATP